MAVLILVSLVTASTVHARDTEYHLKIADVMQDPGFQQRLGTNVRFFFGTQPTPPIAHNFGAYVTNRKTDSVGRPDEQACRWAMLSALIELRERAEKLGGNAVINVVSYYRKNTGSSVTDYECHAGAIVAGVALKGEVVKLAP